MKFARLFLAPLAAPLAALALWAGADASAQTVALAPIAISADLQKDLNNKLGAREAETLRAMLTRNLTRALAQEGLSVAPNGDVQIETEIIDADPNRPTFQQLSRNTSLSYADSLSTGGARLHATVHGAGGAREVVYRYYTPSLDWVIGEPMTWGDADRAMRTFAERVAQAAKETAG